MSSAPCIIFKSIRGNLGAYNKNRFLELEVPRDEEYLQMVVCSPWSHSSCGYPQTQAKTNNLDIVLCLTIQNCRRRSEGRGPTSLFTIRLLFLYSNFHNYKLLLPYYI